MYREILFTTNGAGEFISGVILFDETIRQKTRDGRSFVEVLEQQGIVPGIKVDKGAKAMANFPDEKITEGLDGLRERLTEYRKLKIGKYSRGMVQRVGLAQALLKVGLDPAKDVQWVVNISQPDLMKMLGQGQVDATDLAWQFGVFAQQNKWGPIVATGDEGLDPALGLRGQDGAGVA